MHIPTWRKVLVSVLIILSSLLILVLFGQSIINAVRKYKWKHQSDFQEDNLAYEDSSDQQAKTKPLFVTTTEATTEATTETTTEVFPDEGYLLMIQGRDYLMGFGDDGYDMDHAFQCLNQATELGNADAWYYLGKYYLRSSSLDRFEKANACYDKAIKLGSALGYQGKGELYSSGAGGSLDYGLAITNYNQAIALGDLLSYTDLAIMYIEGNGVERNDELAMQYLEYALASDNPSASNYAYCLIGHLYENGYNGAEPDYTKALEYYQNASNNGYRTAINWIGDCYMNGVCVEQDYSAAYEWYMRSANLGSSSSMNSLGNMYYRGYGVEPDIELALEWYSKSAELGNSYAMGNLSYIYMVEKYGKTDYTKSMEWAQNGLLGGYQNCHFYLGYLYNNGYGVEQNTDIAIDHYKKVIEYHEMDEITAMWNLTVIYYDMEDYESAHDWAERGLAIATEQGNQEYIEEFQTYLAENPSVN